MRRWGYVVALTGLLLAVFYTLHLYGYSDLGGLDFQWPARVTPPYVPKPKVSNDHFLWRDLKTQFPVEDITPLPQGRPRRLPPVQHKFATRSAAEETTRAARQAAVKTAFARCWRSYEENAWLQDELAPLSGSAKNTFGGWAATLVDSLDTLWIMDMKDDFTKASRAAEQIDFSQSAQSTINVFETNIRYLGGFLAAYDLSGDIALLDKAVEVGEMLYVCFDTPNRMPVMDWDLEGAKHGDGQAASPYTSTAGIGSFNVEFTRLSQLTGNPKWFDAVNRITLQFESRQNATKLPGMWPVFIDAKTLDMTKGDEFSVGASADSLYEYFPKTYALLGGLDPVYEKLYKVAMATVSRELFFHPMTPDSANILISGLYYPDKDLGERLEGQGQHLGCYTGGMLALGGTLFDIPEHLELANQLVDGCVWSYKAYPSGLMPEVCHMLPCPSHQKLCAWDEAAWHAEVIRANNATGADPTQLIKDLGLQPGFTKLDDRHYILRPEAIESVFILYRITGREDLLDAAWDMFTSIQKATETPLANGAVSDITVGVPPQTDSMESFWMAETLKYFYLIFSDPKTISLDEYVFNTEAHPLRRPI